MGISLEVVKDTFKIRKHDMEGNRMLTNELIVDELMLALGYNKKIDTFVKRLYDGILDWEIVSPTGNRIALLTYPVGSSIEVSEAEQAFEQAKQNKFVVMLLTNGEILQVWGLDTKNIEYVKLSDINLLSDLDTLDTKILLSISKDGFDNFIIGDMVQSKYLSADKVLELMKKYNDDISEFIASKENIDKIDRLSGLITEILSTKTIEVVDSHEQEDSEKIKELTEEKSKLLDEIENIKNELENTKDDKAEADSLIESLTLENENYKMEIDRLNSKVSENEEMIRLTQQQSNINTGDTKDYIEKINELTGEIEDLREEKEQLQDKIEKMQKQIDELDGADRKRALELLEVIQVNDNEDRKYVGVINTELFQYNELNKFIGASLQKLYEIKGFEASQFIFNGDLFELTQPSIRNDIMMNKKNYDINIDGLNEDEALNKLRIIFSHFDDVIFECKKVGHLVSIEDETESFNIGEIDDISEESDNYETTDFDTMNEEAEQSSDGTQTFDSIEETTYESSFDSLNEEEAVNNYDTPIESDKKCSITLEKFEQPVAEFEQPVAEFEQPVAEFEQPVAEFEQPVAEFEQPVAEFDSESSETLDFSSVANNGYSQDEINDEIPEKLYVTQLLSYGDFILTDDDIEFGNVKYIGNNNITFAISNCDNYNRTLCKSIDAVLAIAEYSGRGNIIKELKMCDLSEISELIKRYTSSYLDYPKITATRYCITGIETMQQLVKILYDFCTEMSIDMSEIFVYVTAKTNSFELNDKYSYNESDVVIYDNIENNYEYQGDDLVAILKGDLFNNIVLTQASLNIHSKLFRQAVGVKTKYLSKSIKEYKDVVDTIKLMIEASITNRIEDSVICKCTKLDGKHRIVSTDESLVTDEHDEVIINDNSFYISKLEDWEVAETLIRLHTEIYNDTAIAVKTLISSTEYDFINTEFNTSEPSLSLAISSIKHYLLGAVRQ